MTDTPSLRAVLTEALPQLPSRDDFEKLVEALTRWHEAAVAEMQEILGRDIDARDKRIAALQVEHARLTAAQEAKPKPFCLHINQENRTDGLYCVSCGAKVSPYDFDPR
jgi:uncharacterized small protein (DUF1192 family)